MGSSPVADLCLTQDGHLIKPLCMQIRDANEQRKPSYTEWGEARLSLLPPSLRHGCCAGLGVVFHVYGADGCRKGRCFTR